MPEQRLLDRRVSPPLCGTFSLPGDKSIAHRALFFAAIDRRLRIGGLPDGADVLSTRTLLERVGYEIRQAADFTFFERTNEPVAAKRPVHLDCGNSGTTARLAAGFLAGESGHWILDGDDSLRRRPMSRVVAPLRQIGVEVSCHDGRLPVSVIANRRDGPRGGPRFNEFPVSVPLAIDVASAQVHASLMLAALRTGRQICLERTSRMRDHTLRMMHLLGYRLASTGRTDRLLAGTIPFAQKGRGPHNGDVIEFEIPGDFSSAAFLIVAATIVPGSSIVIENVGVNPTRTGFFDVASAMGADCRIEPALISGKATEPRGQLRVASAQRLRGLDECDYDLDVADFIDEVPLLGLLAACADGRTTISGASELRRKESDRIASTVGLLRAFGVEVEESADGFAVVGRGGLSALSPVIVDAAADHRIAMLAGIASLAVEAEVKVVGSDAASVSWPEFWELPFFERHS